MDLNDLVLVNKPLHSKGDLLQESSIKDAEVALEDEEEEEETFLEEQITEAADLLETCHKVLKHVCRREPKLETPYLRNLLEDIEFFIASLDITIDGDE